MNEINLIFVSQENKGIHSPILYLNCKNIPRKGEKFLIDLDWAGIEPFEYEDSNEEEIYLFFKIFKSPYFEIVDVLYKYNNAATDIFVKNIEEIKTSVYKEFLESKYPSNTYLDFRDSKNHFFKLDELYKLYEYE